MKIRLIWIVAIVCAVTCLNLQAKIVMYDKFDREGLLHGQKTSDGKFAWRVFPKAAQGKFTTHQGRVNFNATGGVMYIGKKIMRQRDFGLAFDVMRVSQRCARSLSVNYRIQTTPSTRLSDGGHAGGYTLRLARRRDSFILRLLKESAGQDKATTLLAHANIAAANWFDVATRVRLKIEGDRHQIFINESTTPVIDVRDDEFLEPGWWNIADGALASRVIDNLVFCTGEYSRCPLFSQANSKTEILPPCASPLSPKTVSKVSREEIAKEAIDLESHIGMRYTGKVTPTPKQVIGEWRILRLKKSGLEVKLASGAHNSTYLARTQLLERVKRLSKAIKSDSEQTLTIYLGEMESDFINDIARKLELDLTDTVLKPQGYLIRQVDNKILAVGLGHRGTFYAAMTLLQSIGVVDGKLILRCTDLNDWPTWKMRSTSVFALPDPSSLLLMAMYKMNTLWLESRHEWRDFGRDGVWLWGKKPLKQALETYKRFYDRYDLIDYCLIRSIYMVRRRPRRFPVMDISNPNDLTQFADSCAFAAEMGFKRIIIGCDDGTPNVNGRYVCYHPAERNRFRDSLGLAHGYLMRYLHSVLIPRFPFLKLDVVPAPYSLRGHNVEENLSNQKYLNDLTRQLPSDINVVWTGPVVCSKQVTRHDFLTFSRYINDHSTYLWDNSGAFPGPIPRWGEFKTKFYKGFVADSHGLIMLNSDPFGKPALLPYILGANDYLWNPGVYQAYASHKDVVEKIWGRKTYQPVNDFIENYKLLKDVLGKDQKRSIAILDQLDSNVDKMIRNGMGIGQVRRLIKRLRNKSRIILPELTVKALALPPKIDGVLDDTCWKIADKLEFLPVGKTKGSLSTICKILYDDQYLYLGFRAQAPSTIIKTPEIRLEGNIWDQADDIIEIYLQGDKVDCAHLVFDIAGNRYDSEFILGLGRDWNPEWSVATHINESEWSAEIRIPFASLKPVITNKVTADSVWRANFVRKIRSGQQTFAWSPHINGYWGRHYFGKLKFDNTSKIKENKGKQGEI